MKRDPSGIPCGGFAGSNGPDREEVLPEPTVDWPAVAFRFDSSLLITPVNIDTAFAPGWLEFVELPPPSPVGLWLLSSKLAGRRIPAAACAPWSPGAMIEAAPDILPSKEFTLDPRRAKKLLLPTCCAGSRLRGALGSSAFRLTAPPACPGNPTAG